jgi:hypothetical protein
MSKTVILRTATTLGAAALLALAGATSALAQASGERSARGFIGMGIAGGGDTLGTVRFNNGDTTNVKAGAGIDLRAGLDWRAASGPIGVQASVGYFVERVGGSNGSVTFTRYPVEVLAYVLAAGDIRFGVGLRHVGTGKEKGSGAASFASISFKGSTAAVVEGEWVGAGNYGIAVRYANDKYTAPNGAKIDGSHAALRFNWYF